MAKNRIPHEIGRLREAHRELQKKLAACAGELNEAREQQAATAEILRVIGCSPSDALPVFETIARHAAALCGSRFAGVFRFDGESVHRVASHNAGLALAKPHQSKRMISPEISQVCGRVRLSKLVVQVDDAQSDPDHDQRFPGGGGWRRMLGVPMLREGKPLGAIVVGWAEPGSISQSHVSLLKTFAEQAVLAIENVRLFNESTEALEQHSATSEVLKVISRSAFELHPVLQSLLETAVRLCDADKGVCSATIRFAGGDN